MRCKVRAIQPRRSLLRPRTGALRFQRAALAACTILAYCLLPRRNHHKYETAGGLQMGLYSYTRRGCLLRQRFDAADIRRPRRPFGGVWELPDYEGLWRSVVGL